MINDGWLMIGSGGYCPDNTFGIIIQGGAPQLQIGYNPHDYYRYITNLNHSEIALICTNLATYGAPPCMNM